MLRISTINGHERMSTQRLLQLINEAVQHGETEINVAASGQHDIGGPLWNKNGQTINITVANPGQRVGSMCLPNTNIIVEGSAPADAGWLNSGGTITVLGDAGDTAGHCAASGKIYIGGRSGTRTGSLMKHDPELEPPELWILNSTGSFSFEFMSGGHAVICGHESQTLKSVLGERPCVGMVGGTVFFRGPYADIPQDADICPLDETDRRWLQAGLEKFLKAIGKIKLERELSLWKHWLKLIPKKQKNETPQQNLKEYRNSCWFKNGLFGDILQDNMEVISLIPAGDNRLSYPVKHNQENCTDCRSCLLSCPKAAIQRRIINETPVYLANSSKCTGCGICTAVCSKNIWKLQKNLVNCK